MYLLINIWNNVPFNMKCPNSWFADTDMLLFRLCICAIIPLWTNTKVLCLIIVNHESRNLFYIYFTMKLMEILFEKWGQRKRMTAECNFNCPLIKNEYTCYLTTTLNTRVLESNKLNLFYCIVFIKQIMFLDSITIQR